MNAEQFVKMWLNAHKSPVEVEQPTDEEQAHFESILTDMVKARDKEAINAFCHANCPLFAMVGCEDSTRNECESYWNFVRLMKR